MLVKVLGHGFIFSNLYVQFICLIFEPIVKTFNRLSRGTPGDLSEVRYKFTLVAHPNLYVVIYIFFDKEALCCVQTKKSLIRIPRAQNTHTHTRTHTNIHILAHTHTHIHTHTRTYTHTNTYTHIHTHTQTLAHPHTHFHTIPLRIF